MKVYIAGKITGLPNYKQLFDKAERELRERGYIVMNPTVLPLGFEHHEYLKINLAMIDVCDAVYFLNNWAASNGARIEHRHARENNKTLMFQGNTAAKSFK